MAPSLSLKMLNDAIPVQTSSIAPQTPALIQQQQPHAQTSAVPFHTFDRERLFPAAIARSVGLDPDTHAILEVPNGSSSLYNSILLYAANFAIDLHDSFPPLHAEEDSHHEHQRDPSSPSPLSDATKPDDEPAVPADALDIESQFPEIGRGFNGTVLPGREGPGRLSTLWNCPEDRCDPLVYSDSDSDSDSDADSITEANIEAVLNDAAFDGRDIDSCKVPSQAPPQTTTTTTTSTTAVNRTPDEAKSDETSLAAAADCPSLKMGLFLNDCSRPSSVRRTTTRVTRTLEPPIQRYQMGLGFAKARIGDSVVYIHHCAFGLPVSESYSVQVFRTIALAAPEAWQSKELCAVALKWRSDREQRGTRARSGRFSLFRWKTNGAGCGDWCNQGYKRSRPARSVILPDGQLRSIVRDIRDFLARDNKAWYEAHGLPHRRSYLFHGPPGSGKSSTVKMIAGMFKLNACFLGFTSEDFSNQALQDALTMLPRRALLVLEDVDVLFNEDRKSEVSQALTFSGMLNALDGLISVDGIVTIFTTNYLDKLDPALIRGGRVDRRFQFSHPNAKLIATLFKSFYEDAPDALAQQFADAVLARPEEEARSIATLQQHFIYTRSMTAEESVAMVPQFFAEFYPNGATARNPLYI